MHWNFEIVSHTQLISTTAISSVKFNFCTQPLRPHVAIFAPRWSSSDTTLERVWGYMSWHQPHSTHSWAGVIGGNANVWHETPDCVPLPTLSGC